MKKETPLILMESGKYFITGKNESQAPGLKRFEQGDIIHFEFALTDPVRDGDKLRAGRITIVNDNKQIEYTTTQTRLMHVLTKIPIESLRKMRF